MDASSSKNPTADHVAQEARYGARNYAPVPVVVDHAKDCLVWDVDGREYIDMMSAYSAVSHGHLHPRIVAAAERQLQQVAVMSRAYYGTTLGPFLQKLSEVTGFGAGGATGSRASRMASSRSWSRAATSMAAPAPSSASPASRNTAPASARSAAASSISTMATWPA